MSWRVGDSVPFNLSLAPESSPDEPATSGEVDVVSMLGGTTDPDSAEDGEEEGGGTSRWVGWLAAAGALIVASIGYATYRVLR